LDRCLDSVTNHSSFGHPDEWVGPNRGEHINIHTNLLIFMQLDESTMTIIAIIRSDYHSKE